MLPQSREAPGPPRSCIPRAEVRHVTTAFKPVPLRAIDRKKPSRDYERKRAQQIPHFSGFARMVCRAPKKLLAFALGMR